MLLCITLSSAQESAAPLHRFCHMLHEAANQRFSQTPICNAENKAGSLAAPNDGCFLILRVYLQVFSKTTRY